jgi:hypothetical protein
LNGSIIVIEAFCINQDRQACPNEFI